MNMQCIQVHVHTHTHTSRVKSFVVSEEQCMDMHLCCLYEFPHNICHMYL
jgi:hypothetical protein